MTDNNKQDLPETPLTDEEFVPTADNVGQPHPDAEPDLSSAFGESVQVEVNSIQFSVLVMCWNLASHGVLGDRRLVNIASDEEALDIMSHEGIPTPVQNADGLWQTSMGFQHEADGHVISRFQIADASLPLLAIRSLHVKYIRWDPEVATVINKFFQVQAAQQARDLTNQKSAH